MQQNMLTGGIRALEARKVSLEAAINDAVGRQDFGAAQTMHAEVETIKQQIAAFASSRAPLDANTGSEAGKMYEN